MQRPVCSSVVAGSGNRVSLSSTRHRWPGPSGCVRVRLRHARPARLRGRTSCCDAFWRGSDRRGCPHPRSKYCRPLDRVGAPRSLARNGGDRTGVWACATRRACHEPKRERVLGPAAATHRRASFVVVTGSDRRGPARQSPCAPPRGVL